MLLVSLKLLDLMIIEIDLNIKKQEQKKLGELIIRYIEGMIFLLYKSNAQNSFIDFILDRVKIYNQLMQLLINYSAKLKLSPVINSYQELQNFVRQQFKPSQPWDMNYIDCDGDRICLSAEEDFQSLADYNKKMTMIKINVIDNKNRKDFEQYSKQTMSFSQKMLTQSVKKINSPRMYKQQDTSLRKHISEPEQISRAYNINSSCYSEQNCSQMKLEQIPINEKNIEKQQPKKLIPIIPNQQRIDQEIKKSSIILKMTDMFGMAGLENYLIFYQNYKQLSQEEILSKWAGIHLGWTIVDDDIVNDALQE